MEEVANTPAGSVVVSAKVSKAQREELEQMRKTLRLRSVGEVLRLAVTLMQQTLEMQKMVPATMDEQKALFAALNKFTDELPEDLTPEASMREVLRKGKEYIEERTEGS